jgi:tripartite-type tricarboxylate transporter receptor subunit TctC
MVRYISNFIKVILATSITLTAHAWEPTKPITAVVGFAPGSGNELSFRGISSIIEKANPKINFIVENRPGGDGTIGMNHFVKLPNDGYHISIPSHQGIWVTADFSNPENKKYTLDDFEYVLTLAKSPLAIIANSASTVNTPREFLDRVKTTDKPVNIASGSSGHKLAYEYMMHNIKGNRDLVKTIPYKGPAQAGQDVAGGHVEFGIIPVAVANTLLQSGKIKIIALCSEYKIDAIKDVPLMKDLVPGMNVYAAWGIVLPKNTDKEIVDWYVTNFTNAIRSNDGQRFLRENLMFAEPKEQTPSGFKASMIQLREKWVPIIKEVGWSN